MQESLLRCNINGKVGVHAIGTVDRGNSPQSHIILITTESLATEENVLQFQVSSTYSQKLIPRPVAILDLSERVFADGMAHVALSRVQGLHLTAFDSKSTQSA